MTNENTDEQQTDGDIPEGSEVWRLLGRARVGRGRLRKLLGEQYQGLRCDADESEPLSEEEKRLLNQLES